MTYQEYENKLKTLSAIRKQQKKQFQEEYDKAIADAVAHAREKLKIENDIAKAAHMQAIEMLGTPERNHYNWTRKCAHTFMRYMKKAAMDFVPDKREFEMDGEQVSATVNQIFNIQPDTVTFTITVEMKRKH